MIPNSRGSIHAGNIVVRAPGFLAGTYGPAAFDIIAEGKTLFGSRVYALTAKKVPLPRPLR